MIARVLLAAATLVLLAAASYHAGGHELLDAIRSVQR